MARSLVPVAALVYLLIDKDCLPNQRLKNDFAAPQGLLFLSSVMGNDEMMPAIIKSPCMSTWRKKAIECAPELKKEFNAADLTVYTVFMELLPITVQAHIDRDPGRLKKIYNYAAWCFSQKDKDLWNAAGVCFYEHLGDHEASFSAFTSWISKETYDKIRGLLNLRLTEDKMKQLDRYYRDH